jgi:hypothetical protein
VGKEKHVMIVFSKVWEYTFDMVLNLEVVHFFDDYYEAWMG